MHFISILIFTILIGLPSKITHAQEQYNKDYIYSYDVDIKVEESGKILVAENIIYDFGNEQWHGIFRTIPFIIINEDGQKYVMQIEDVSVTDQNGKPYRYAEEKNGEELNFEIGNPNSTFKLLLGK